MNISRRQALGTLSGLAASLLIRPPLLAASPAPTPKTQPAPSEATGKTVILVFLAGGPSHTDTFDPKPEKGRSIAGNYLKPIQTNNPNLRINEKLQHLAKIADKYSIIRSMTHNSNAHEIGQYVIYTGDMTKGKIVYPSFGAMISYLNPMDYKGKLPPYICITKSATRFNEGGFLGSLYKPLDTLGKPESDFFEVEGIINRAVSSEDMLDKQQLLSAVSTEQHGMIELNEEQQLLEKMQKENFDLLLGESREIFNLKNEDQATRERYGLNNFGQSCLVARRLAEHGTPVISVVYNGWDTHKEHFKRMDQRLGTLDQGLAALISDLDKRKLLDQTIVLCGGEFGRSPQVMYDPPWNGGRGHYGDAFSYLIAGGGFAGGKVIGSTNATSEQVATRPVYPADLIGSVYNRMGIDPMMRVAHNILGDIPILPSLLEPGQHSSLLEELYIENQDSPSTTLNP